MEISDEKKPEEVSGKEIKWINDEIEKINKDFVRLPYLIIEEGTIVEIDINFSKPFEKWIDPDTGIVKKIIPITHNGEKKVFFLNTANPLYQQLLKLAGKGITHFRIKRIGQRKATRYDIVDDKGNSIKKEMQ